MYCKCGLDKAEMSYTQHEVKTLRKAEEYFLSVDGTDLPILVSKHSCKVCGRAAGQIFNVRGKLLTKFGQI